MRMPKIAARADTGQLSPSKYDPAYTYAFSKDLNLHKYQTYRTFWNSSRMTADYQKEY